jgi:hypothetical protein
MFQRCIQLRQKNTSQSMRSSSGTVSLLLHLGHSDTLPRSLPSRSPLGSAQFACFGLYFPSVDSGLTSIEQELTQEGIWALEDTPHAHFVLVGLKALLPRVLYDVDDIHVSKATLTHRSHFFLFSSLVFFLWHGTQRV